MGSLEEHEEDTLKQLGKPFTEVHEFLDQHSSRIGARHRFVLHHREGIEEVRRRFGDEAARAAECHVRLDCMGRIPKREDYEAGRVDWLGLGDDDFKVTDKRRFILTPTGSNDEK